jgi:hypothetical protein
MRYAGVIALILASGIWSQEIRTVQIVTGLSGVTDIQNAGDGSGRLFLVQQNGVIRMMRNDALLTAPFLDIRGKTRADGERGLLGLAFPPGFAGKQRFYVDYTDLNGDTVIAQYRVSPNGEVADAASEAVLLKIAQPFANHNGGQVRFGRTVSAYRDGRRRVGRRPDAERAESGGTAGQTPAHRCGEQSRAGADSRGQSVRQHTGCTRRGLGVRAAESMALQFRPRDPRAVDRRCRAGHVRGSELSAGREPRR